jgi:hypothetical protein
VDSIEIDDGVFNLTTATGAGIGSGLQTGTGIARFGSIVIGGGTFVIDSKQASGVGIGATAASGTTSATADSTVTIYDGTFTVGVTEAAGIGGGAGTGGPSGLKRVLITGGEFSITVTDGAGIGSGFTTAGRSVLDELIIDGGSFRIWATRAVGIGAAASQGGSTTVTSLKITDGDFTINGKQGAGIGSGFVSTPGSSTVADLSISGGLFDITQDLGPAIGAGYSTANGGSSDAIASTVTALKVFGGTIIAKTLGDNDPVIGAGARGSGDNVKSIVGTISITGGVFDLTAKIPSGIVENYPPAIGYPNTDVHSDIGINMIIIRDATFRIDAPYLVDGANAGSRLQSVTFLGDVTILSTSKTASGGLVHAAIITVSSGCSLTVTTPVKVFGTKPSVGTVAPAPVITIFYSQAMTLGTIDAIDSFRLVYVTFGSTLKNEMIDMLLRPAADGYQEAYAHTVTVNLWEIKELVLSVTVATPNNNPPYRLYYYRWSTGEVGYLCAGGNPAGTSQWDISTSQNQATNLVACAANPMLYVATKTSPPQTMSRSQSPTISRITDPFTPFNPSYDSRRSFRTLSLFVIALLL